MRISQNAKTINIISIIERTLNYVDDRLIDLGNRVAYILYRVLKSRNRFIIMELRKS